MLRKLTVSNLALITLLELEFCENLNILSGETGAGKSIIVDSLMLLLGARYDKTLLRFSCESGFVEGVFDSNERADSVMDELGMERDDTVIVLRRFFLDGKKEIRINGRAATTSMLKQLMGALVDIYGQNEYQSLSKTSEHLRILDYYVRHKTEHVRGVLPAKVSEYKAVVREIGELGETGERERTIDLLRYQIDEIDNAKIKEGEEDELLAARKKAAATEQITAALAGVCSALYDDDSESASELCGRALRALGGISDISPEYESLYERLSSAVIEIEDIAETVRGELDDVHFDFDELERIEKRLELVRSMRRKYGDREKMLAYRKKADEQLYKLEHCSELYEQLTARRDKLTDEIYALSKQLHDAREEGGAKLSEEIIGQLADLGMEGARFEVRLDEFCSREECDGRISANGMDKAEFYLSPNVGQPLKPLIKIISGGELSRFMLALKVISSRTDDIPTMIYDEIDTGISGKIGQEVAKKLASISRKHQILCVTHLPQIAAMADEHYYISKETRDGETVTNVQRLQRDGMVEEVSRLSGAKDISAASSQNALQMKKWSDDYKAALKNSL